MAHTLQKKRVVGNPGRRAFGGSKKKYKRPAAKHHASRSRSNVGDILGFTLAGAGNPGRKRGSMAKAKVKKYKKHSAARGSHSKHHKGNPGTKMKHYRRTHHNPGMGALGPLVTNAVFVIVGALGSKLGAQAVLGAKNVGLIGYAGNAAAGGILWFITEKVMKNRAASTGVIAGTIVQIVLRILNDYTPFGAYVAQLGMGDYQMQSFVTPQVLVDPMRNAEVSIPSGWGGGGGAGVQRMLSAGNSPAPSGPGSPAAAMAATSGGAGGPGMGGLYGGGWGGGLYG